LTNQNKKRPKGYRGPARDNGGTSPPAKSSSGGSRGGGASSRGPGPQRKGILDTFLAPKAPNPHMPRTTKAIGRGFIVAASSPPVVVFTMLAVFLGWLALLALGFQGPLHVLGTFLALPPLNLFGQVLQVRTVLIIPANLMLLILVAVDALIYGILTSLVVDAITEVEFHPASLLRGIVLFPYTLAVSLIGLVLVFIGYQASLYLGPGLGLIALIATLVAGVYLFAYAPTIRLVEGRGLAQTLSRSFRAARMPGTGNLAFTALYVFAMLAVQLLFSGSAGLRVGVNAGPALWFAVLLVNFLQAAFLGAFAFRYLSIADQVDGYMQDVAQARAQRGRR
jgi:hypothetical protein